ncbi:MAG: tail fiber domain-containing protein [Leptospiraceae bacterium]|nr:tail fiber domain-containing protein [Leptospiraceae bacterium]
MNIKRIFQSIISAKQKNFTDTESAKTFSRLSFRTAMPTLLSSLLLFTTSLTAAPVTGTIKTWAANDKLSAADLNQAITSLKTGITNIPNWTKSGSNAYFTDGNVGIGTTSPGQTLHLHNGSQPVLQLTSTSGLMNMGANNTDSWIGSPSNPLELIVGGSERMRIAASGNIGVGTNNPQAKLDILGDGIYIQNNNTNNNLKVTRLGSLSYSNSSFYPLIWATSSGSAGTNDSYIGIGGGTSLGYAANSVRFFTATNDTTALGTERMRIDLNGNVGIGNTNPTSKLHISHPGGSSPIYFMDLYTVTFGTGTNAQNSYFIRGGDSVQPNIFVVRGDGHIGIQKNPEYPIDVVGDINTTSCLRIGGAQTTGSCSSDARLKKSIQPIQNSLSKLLALNPSKYSWRKEEFSWLKNTPDSETGLLAQDVEKVFPHLVSTDEKGYKKVNYGMELNMHVIAAIKELSNKNEILEKHNETLEHKISQITTEGEKTISHLRELKHENKTLKAELSQLKKDNESIKQQNKAMQLTFEERLKRLEGMNYARK